MSTVNSPEHIMTELIIYLKHASGKPEHEVMNEIARSFLSYALSMRDNYKPFMIEL